MNINTTIMQFEGGAGAGRGGADGAVRGGRSDGGDGTDGWDAMGSRGESWHEVVVRELEPNLFRVNRSALHQYYSGTHRANFQFFLTF